jgi:hypothetical protein
VALECTPFPIERPLQAQRILQLGVGTEGVFYLRAGAAHYGMAR